MLFMYNYLLVCMCFACIKFINVLLSKGMCVAKAQDNLRMLVDFLSNPSRDAASESITYIFTNISSFYLVQLEQLRRTLWEF